MTQLNPESALRILVSRRSEILSYIFANTLDMHAAEDVYQDVLVKVMRREEPYESQEHVIRWAQRVARNAVIDLSRSANAKVAPLDSDVIDLIEDQWDSLNAPPHGELVEYLRHCLAGLSPSVREILDLRYREGLTGAMLGERLNRPPKSIYVTISRAYRTLAECIERQQREADSRG